MKAKLGSVWVAALAVSATSATVNASTPLGTVFTYQGTLTDGADKADGAYDFEFRLFDMDLGGMQVGATIPIMDHDVDDGLFTVELDFGAVYTGDTRWLEVRVRLGSSGGGFTILAPRQKLSATPYALGIRLPWSQTVNTSSNAITIIQGPTGTGDVAQFEITNAANVGEVFEAHTNGGGDSVQAFNTGTGRAGYFQKTNAAGSAVTVEIDAEGSGDALDIQHDGTGNGFDVVINDVLSTGDAVQAGTNGLGHAGNFNLANTASSENAVEIDSNGNSTSDALNVVHAGLGDCGYFEITNAASNGEAVEGRTNGAGDAIQGINTGTGLAGYFESDAYGIVVNTNSVTIGEAAVWGEVLGATDFGNYGVAGENDLGNFDTFGYLAGANYGAYGECFDGALSSGLLGDCNSSMQGVNEHEDSTAVHGIAHKGASSYAIWGESDQGEAGHFSGDVAVTGLAFSAGGGFRIDHPLDPENMVLQHSSVTSSEMMNVYNGNVITDKSGVAVVTLPDWFEALNGDFRYQLTVIGQFAQAIVAEKIQDNEFNIRTDKPNVEVSWQVTGIRQDPTAMSYRIQVEQNKPEQARGYYIRPELYGAVKSMRMEEAMKPVANTIEAAPVTEDGRALRSPANHVDSDEPSEEVATEVAVK